MSGEHPTADTGLRERYEALDRQKGELSEKVRVAERAVNRRELKLVHWEQAVVRERHERGLLARLVVLALVLALGAGVALMTFKRRAGRAVATPVEVVYKTSTPRLMVSATPPAALVIVNGKTEGQTPLVRPLPPGETFTVEVRAAGYDIWRKTFTGGKQGRHVHADLMSTEPR